MGFGSKNSAPLPRGARDLLPRAAARRRTVVNRLLGTFEAWGYGQVVTPAVEYFDVIARGLSDQQRARSIRFMEPGSGELVGLRADITPQIARMVASRAGAEFPADVPVRLCYAADVVCQPDGLRGCAERHQVGVELVGDGSPAADAELIALCHAALSEVGLPGVRIDLAHTEVARGVLAEVGLKDGGLVSDLHRLLARKDADGARARLEDALVSPATAQAVVELCGLFGDPSVLRRARRVVTGQPAVAALDRLSSVLEALEHVSPAAHAAVGIDLGEVRGFDYYTGLRLRVWAAGASTPLARGGRYNHLLARYGEPRPATGFAFDLDALEAALARAGTPPPTDRAPACLVVTAGDSAGERREASRRAHAARAEGYRAWVCPGIGRRRGQEVARAMEAGWLVVVGEAVHQFEISDDKWIPVEEKPT